MGESVMGGTKVNGRLMSWYWCRVKELVSSQRVVTISDIHVGGGCCGKQSLLSRMNDYSCY